MSKKVIFWCVFGSVLIYVGCILPVLNQSSKTGKWTPVLMLFIGMTALMLSGVNQYIKIRYKKRLHTIGLDVLLIGTALSVSGLQLTLFLMILFATTFIFVMILSD